MPSKSKEKMLETSPINFEAALAELNELVEIMEHGGLSLELSLKNFERGVLLVKQCQQALQQAEQKIQILTEKNGTVTFENYHSDEL